MKKIILIPILLLSLAGCGFEPVHGKPAAGSQSASLNKNLQSIAITVDRSRFGQLLEAELKDQLNPNHEKVDIRYRLRIVLTESESSNFINTDGTSSRNNINFSTSYHLTDLETGEQIDAGDVNRISSYNLSELADFATFVAQQDARRRGILELARSYKLRLLNALSNQK